MLGGGETVEREVRIRQDERDLASFVKLITDSARRERVV